MEDLLNDLEWLKSIIELRLKATIAFYNGKEQGTIDLPLAPILEHKLSAYGVYIEQHGFSEQERLLFILSIIPHLDSFYLTKKLSHPQKVVNDLSQNIAYVRYDTPKFLEFGLVRDRELGYYLPTGETFLYLLAGTNLSKRLKYTKVLGKEQAFFQTSLFKNNPSNSKKVFSSEILLLSRELYEEIISV